MSNIGHVIDCRSSVKNGRKEENESHRRKYDLTGRAKHEASIYRSTDVPDFKLECIVAAAKIRFTDGFFRRS